jgi:hypothetical protein
MTVVNRITKELIACGVISASRYYLYFDGNTYVQIDDILLSGDYFIEFEYYLNALRSSNTIFATDDGSKSVWNGLLRLNNGNVQWRPSTNAYEGIITTGEDATPVMKKAKVKVERLGSIGYIYVDEILVMSGSVPSGDFVVRKFGKVADQYLVGYLFNININDVAFYELSSVGSVANDSVGVNDGVIYNAQSTSFVRSMNA